MNSSQNKTLIIIGGPTGVGKSALAIDLALHLNTEIINADSRQIFKELNIGVNKPSNEELRKITHHLIGHVSIHEEYNAGKYETQALQTLDDIFRKKNSAIMVGGTGLYIRALIEGLDEFPDIHPSIKNEVEDIYKATGLKGLLSKVSALDPIYYSTVDQKNPRRLSRALEVILQTGTTFSALKSSQVKQRPFGIVKLFIDEDRDRLYKKIEERVDIMVKSGLEQEALLLYPLKHLKSLQTVGYTEWFEHFDGATSKTETILKIKQHTRNYAKRQWTWWKPLGWPTYRINQWSNLLQYVDSNLSQ